MHLAVRSMGMRTAPAERARLGLHAILRSHGPDVEAQLSMTYRPKWMLNGYGLFVSY